MDITEEWLDTKNIDSINLNVQGPIYIYPDSDINSRPPIRNMKKMNNIYPECFSGIRTIIKDYKCHTGPDPKVKPVVHPPKKIALSLQPYDITFKYVSGQKVPVAETLSNKTEIKEL